eukprot:GHVU01023105.1.p1 GENE.GHVU01023105.1~~GHVU01023105.1.p1  ORF type:complete len:125 (+),score=2.56 GHVU01023105.1:181-555(+)
MAFLLPPTWCCFELPINLSLRGVWLAPYHFQHPEKVSVSTGIIVDWIGVHREMFSKASATFRIAEGPRLGKRIIAYIQGEWDVQSVVLLGQGPDSYVDLNDDAPDWNESVVSVITLDRDGKPSL